MQHADQFIFGQSFPAALWLVNALSSGPTLQKQLICYITTLSCIINFYRFCLFLYLTLLRILWISTRWWKLSGHWPCYYTIVDYELLLYSVCGIIIQSLSVYNLCISTEYEYNMVIKSWSIYVNFWKFYDFWLLNYGHMTMLCFFMLR